MARNRGRIEKLGEGHWRIRWHKGLDGNGRRVNGSKNIRGTKRQAQAELTEALSRQDRGLQTPSPSKVPRLRDQVEAWKASQTVAKLRDSTRRQYVALLDRDVVPRLGGLRLDAIHTSTIEHEVVAPLVARGRNRSAQLAVAALSTVLRDALKDPSLGLHGNPCRGVTVPRKPRVPIQPLAKEERDAFLQGVAGTDHETFWTLLLLTGLSPHEALGLGFEHLDFEAAELRVARTLDTRTGVLVEDTKRASRKRTVPLVPELRAKLRERWMAAGRPEAGLVFADALGQPLSLDHLRRCFKAAIKAAGITRRVTPYGLRHLFASTALEAGADVVTVSRLLGHSSVTTTQNIYMHVSAELKRDAVDAIAARLIPR